MRAVWSIGLAVIALTAILLGIDVFALRHVAVEPDERPGAFLAPQRVLTRIQADLERVAVGRSRGAPTGRRSGGATCPA